MSGGPNIVGVQGGGRVPVAPRVRAVDGEEVLPLVYHVDRCIAAGRVWVINVVVERRSGKTMALRHVREVFGEVVVVRDDVSTGEELLPEKLMVIASGAKHPQAAVVLHLEPWGEDDVIEYMLAVNRRKCASVMKRWGSCAAWRLQGVPGFVAPVLEEFLADEELRDVDAALRRHLRRQVGSDEEYRGMGSLCLNILMLNRESSKSSSLYHPYAMLLLASEGLAAGIRERDFRRLSRPLPSELVAKTGELLRGDAKAREILEGMAGETQIQAAVVGILLAIDPGWRPEEVQLSHLSRARLCGAKWEGVNLASANLSGADLRGADLTRAHLKGANLRGAQCAGALFVQAQMEGIVGVGTDFTRCDLFGAVLEMADLMFADFTDARLAVAKMEGASMRNAVLTRASLLGAQMSGVHLRGAKLEGASFQNADLRNAIFWNGVMRDAEFRGAVLSHAKIRSCDLEGMTLRGMDFRGANFAGSYLTGSDFSGSDLGGANLRETGLAEVNWEKVDLRGADFTRASFHLGSSRSGLVGSVIASEGTRTGFYTDDYCDQEFKAPEEIRKANLCGCDLREAVVTGTDFYLVDLRGARYSPEQGRHFAGCGAILRGRV